MPGGTGPLSALESHERPFQPHALLNNIHFYLAGTTESLQKGQIAQQRHSNGNAGIMSAVSLPRASRTRHENDPRDPHEEDLEKGKGGGDRSENRGRTRIKFLS